LSRFTFRICKYDLGGLGSIERKIVVMRPLFNIFDFHISSSDVMLLAEMIGMCNPHRVLSADAVFKSPIRPCLLHIRLNQLRVLIG